MANGGNIFFVMKFQLAVVIPFRTQSGFDRESQLRELTECFDSFLSSKTCTVVVVEQLVDGLLFNRGQLLNIGTLIVENLGGARALCFHDVDLVPSKELQGEYMRCLDDACHIASQYERYAGPGYRGGITRIPYRSLVRANGFPNNFWGWGGEDDALGWRLQNTDCTLTAARGRVFDREVFVPTGKVLDRAAKLSFINSESLGCGNKRELLSMDRAYWCLNGLSSTAAPTIRAEYKIPGSNGLEMTRFVVTVDRDAHDLLNTISVPMIKDNGSMDMDSSGDCTGGSRQHDVLEECTSFKNIGARRRR